MCRKPRISTIVYKIRDKGEGGGLGKRGRFVEGGGDYLITLNLLDSEESKETKRTRGSSKGSRGGRRGDQNSFSEDH